ncbi:hypothetical protein BSLA_02f2147 [Burkholderia stabilis]|nr:hypothetical protein BSLA_02f2147 [Burkholderia stabilis]
MSETAAGTTRASGPQPFAGRSTLTHFVSRIGRRRPRPDLTIPPVSRQ